MRSGTTTKAAFNRPTKAVAGKRLRFDASAFAALIAPLGLIADAEIAAFLDVDPSTWFRARTGGSTAGSKFVAHVMGATYPNGRPDFDTLFAVVDVDDIDEAA